MGTAVPQAYLSSYHEFTESLSSELPFTQDNKVEEFTKLSPQHMDLPLSPLPLVLVGDVTIRSFLKNLLPQTPSPDRKKSENAASHTEAVTVNILLQQATIADSPQNTFLAHAITMNNENEKLGAPNDSEPATNTKTQREGTANTLSMSAIISAACVNSSRVNVHVGPEQAVPPSFTGRDGHRGPVTRQRPAKDLDPLSSFMMLRSQQTAAIHGTVQSSARTPALKVKQKIPNAKLQPPAQQIPAVDKRVTCMSAAVGGNATRENAADQLINHQINQSIPQDRLSSRVLQVQASESQKHAYYELLAFIQPHLSSARELGLSSSGCGDFSHLTPDQSHFLLKQQEQQLSRTQGKSLELVKDQEQLFSRVALIHVVVTVKELLLKCDLSAAVAYLVQAAEVCAEQSLALLVKRLQIILYLSHRNQESNLKLLQLQQHLTAWKNSIKTQNTTSKILVITTVDSEDVRSAITKGLSQVTAITTVSPDEVKAKLKAATVLSSVHDNVCVVVCDQHIGADFPWHHFSLVVEYEGRGQSPWSSVCRERNISHISFHTVLPNAGQQPDTTCYSAASDVHVFYECVCVFLKEVEKALWCLEDDVSYVLFVTDGLLNCQLLLQTLESVFNITVLERRHCPSLQILGGTHHYAVITVDESTAIIIQEQDELCEERASEGVVMRLTALSLQYNCCWLILHCPESCDGGSATTHTPRTRTSAKTNIFNLKDLSY
ncbi:hypothetical protein LDENG_00210560 [Lucifuga dentata]|nr:hypothetical protein LDENG_00210560 [Lucifuga dentata]